MSHKYARLAEKGKAKKKIRSIVDTVTTKDHISGMHSDRCLHQSPWRSLPLVGLQAELELRNCHCGSTLARPAAVLPSVAALLSQPLSRSGPLVRTALWCRLDTTACELDALNAGWSPLGRKDRATERRVAALARERVRLWEDLGLCPEHGDHGCSCDDPADDETYAEHMAGVAEARAYAAEGEVGL